MTFIDDEQDYFAQCVEQSKAPVLSETLLETPIPPNRFSQSPEIAFPRETPVPRPVIKPPGTEDYLSPLIAQSQLKIAEIPESFGEKLARKNEMASTYLPGDFAEHLYDQPPLQFELAKMMLKKKMYASPQYWKNIDPKKALGNLVKQVDEFVQHSWVNFPKELKPFLGEKIGLRPTKYEPYKSAMREPTPILEQAKGVAQVPVEFATYLPKMAIEFEKDPVRMINERPLDVGVLATAILGPKIKGFIKRGHVEGKQLKKMLNQAEKRVISNDAISAIPDDLYIDLKFIGEKLPMMEKAKGAKPSITKQASAPEPSVGYQVGDFITRGEQQFRVSNIKQRKAPLEPIYEMETSRGEPGPQMPPSEMKKLGFEKTEPELKEFHSGYPFTKEFKESLKRFREGPTPFIHTESQKKIKPPKVISASTPKVDMGPYTWETDQPLEIVHMKKNGDMPVLKHELNSVIHEDVKDLPHGMLKLSIENPIRIFENYPSIKEAIYNPYNKASKNYVLKNRAITEKGGVIDRWKDSVKKEGIRKSGSSKNIGIYLTKNQKGGAEKLKASGVQSLNLTDLTPAEQAIAKDMRTRFDKFLVEINRARSLAGQKPLKQTRNYFTWMTNLEQLGESGISIILDNPEMVKKNLDGLSTKHLQGVPFKYATPRSGGAAPIHLDAFKVFEKYAHDANQVIELTPIIAKSKALLEDMKLPVRGTEPPMKWNMWQRTPKLATYLQYWSDAIAGKRQTSNPYARYFEKYAKKLNKNIAIAILSGNVRSALIQPSALRNTWTELGTRWLVQGLQENLVDGRRSFAMNQSNVLVPRNMDIHIAKLMEDTWRGKVGKIKGKVGEVGIKYGLQFLDLETARATWLGAYAKAKKLYKMPESKAFIYADDIVTKTQASGRLGDVAAIQRSPWGRLMTLFQTFVINEWNFISKDVLGIRNPNITAGQRIAKTTRLVVSTAAINALMEGVLNIRSPFPAPEWALKHAIEEGKEGKELYWTAAKEMAEQIPVIGGSIRWSQPWRTPLPAALQTGVDAISAAEKIFVKASPESLSIYDLETIGKLLGIPLTSQVAKYVRRRKKGLSHARAILGVRTDAAQSKKKKSSGYY